MSTIIAPASGTNRAGVIVIRISGENAGKIIEIITNKPVPKPRLAVVRDIYDKDGGLIDKALILFFKAPASFTGEDICEIHIHGGPSVLRATMARCLETQLVNMAKPGEFTKRAFHNGKMDLTEAEGLADLIDAETDGQRKQAMRQMRGELGRLANEWREQIIDCLAEAEAYIDFPDEDLPSALSDNNRIRIKKLANNLQNHIYNSKKAQKIRDGFQIVIIGAPNVGKSSLLNYLAGREAAIVSSIAGTTRDIVEVSFILDGNLISIADTAGLREAKDIIEQEGIKRALSKCEEADLIIGLASNLEEFELIKDKMNQDTFLCYTKIDKNDKFLVDTDATCFSISTKTGDGISDLENAISEICHSFNEDSESAPLTRLRHQLAVENCLDHLNQALNIDDISPEIACEELRLAARSLGELVGVVGIEDIYDRIFSSFCIGK